MRSTNRDEIGHIQLCAAESAYYGETRKQGLTRVCHIPSPSSKALGEANALERSKNMAFPSNPIGGSTRHEYCFAAFLQPLGLACKDEAMLEEEQTSRSSMLAESASDYFV